jgi:hypothetical protein
LFNQAAEFGLKNVRFMEAYSYVYSLPHNELENLAYFFEFEYGDGREPADYVAPLIDEVERWAALALNRTPRLDAISAGDVFIIKDTRPCATQGTHVVTGLAARVYACCDSARNRSGIARAVKAEAAELDAALDRLVANKLIVEMDGQFVSLAVFRNRKTEEAPSDSEAQLVALI